MPHFVAYLLLMGVWLSLGLLVAIALPARGLRVGLGALTALAAVIDLTWFAAPLIGWSARLGDAAWIAAFLGVLGLALSRPQIAAHGWQGPSPVTWPRWDWSSLPSGRCCWCCPCRWTPTRRVSAIWR